MPKDDVLDLFGRQPQFAAQDFKEDHAKIGPVFEHGQKIAPVQYQEFAICQCDGVGASLVAIERGDFAEDLARVEDRKHDFLTAIGKRTDLDTAPEDRHQALAGRAFREDLATSSIALDVRISDQLIYFTGAQFPEQEVALEYLPPLVIACWFYIIFFFIFFRNPEQLSVSELSSSRDARMRSFGRSTLRDHVKSPGDGYKLTT